MLIQFSVENYLSFDELTHFSMLSSADDDHPNHVVKAGEVAVAKGAAIYGANAAGKSNLLAAMEFSRRLILRGVRPAENFGHRPFAFGTQRPTRFDWIFHFESVMWSYSLSIEGTCVVAESLYARPDDVNDDQLLFERTTTETGETVWKFGALLRGEEASRQSQVLEFVAEGCRAEQPFVTEALERNVSGIDDFHQWFANCLRVVTPKSSWGGMKWGISSTSLEENGNAFEPVRINDQQFIRFLNEFLRFADTGIERVQWERGALNPESLSSLDLDEDAKEFFRTVARVRENQPAQIIFFPATGMPSLVTFDDEGAWLLTPKAIHLDEDGKEHSFSFDVESAGTRRMLQLIPWLFRLRSTPTVLIVDELDQHLHTLLAREFIKFALDASPGAGGQLIFTTHDTNLLDNWLLRRDELWLVQKTQGRSTLSQLSEWDIKEGTDLEKAYLLGRFDGRPFFGFAPELQGLDVPANVHPPTEAELQKQLSEVE